MSFGVMVLVALATAAVVIVATLVVSKLVRVGIASAGDFVSGERGWKAIAAKERVPAFEVGTPAFAQSGGGSLETRIAAYGSNETQAAVHDQRNVAAHDDGAPTQIDGDGVASYAHLGEEVAAILTSAEHAAAQIREAALKEAGERRNVSEQTAAATLAEAAAVRADADRYAEATRRAADEEAAKTVEEAQQQARNVVSDAEQTANSVIADAKRQRDALSKSADDIEHRIASLATAFRGVTTELDEMLSTRRGTDAESAETPSDEPLDDALKRAAAPKAAQANADQ
jgi:hypothetical protein